MFWTMDKLIEEVEKYKELYDVQDPFYKDKRRKDRAWTAIAEAVDIEGFDDCRRRWKSLRDIFVKMKKNKGVSKEWKYAKKMSFILPYLHLGSSKNTLGLEGPLEEDNPELCAVHMEPELSNSRSLPSSLPPHQSSSSSVLPPDTQPGTSNTQDWVQALLAEESKISSQPAPPTVSTVPRPAPGRPGRLKRPAPPSVEQQLLDVLTQPPVAQRPHVPSEGEEMYFFVMSLVPRLNRLSRQSQIQAQMHFLTYLNELEEKEPAQPRPSASHRSNAFHPYSSSQCHQASHH